MPILQAKYDVPKTSWVLVESQNSAKSKNKRSRKNVDKREAVRQWLLHELIVSYGYPKEWVGFRIRAPRESDVAGEPPFGLVICLEDDTPFAWMSIESPGKGSLAENKLISALLASPIAGLGIATDGTESGTRYLRRRFDSANCERITDFETYISPASPSTPAPFVTPPGSRGRKISPAALHVLKPLDGRVENLFFEIHSDLRDIDGILADEALDELMKLILLKIHDEELTGPGSSPKLQRWLYGSTEETAANARQMLACLADETDHSLARTSRNTLYEKDTEKHRFRVSSAALSRVVEGLQRFGLTESSMDAKGRAFQQLISPAIRAGMGQFFTPEPVVKFMVSTISPRIGDLVLDPFAGSGRFLSTTLKHLRTLNGGGRKKLVIANSLHGIEKSERMMRVAQVDMKLQEDGCGNLRCADSLLDFSNYSDLSPGTFDIVMTNPPFGSLLRRDAISRLGKFELARSRSTVPLELLGLERCLQFLRPGGRLAIVLPEGVLGNEKTRYVRDWLTNQAKICALVGLPIETFAPYGANVRTAILLARKWNVGERTDDADKVGIVKVDSVGYDASGRVNNSSDLEQCEKRLSAFFDAKGW